MNYFVMKTARIGMAWLNSLILIISGVELTGCASANHSQRESTVQNQQFAAAEMNQDAILHRGFEGPAANFP